MSASALDRARALLQARTGMIFPREKADYIERRVRERMKALAMDAPEGYLALLGRDGGELQELINLVTVNETSFFREEYQLRCLVKSLLPELHERSLLGGHLRLWSAPCATGEEPYSMAIYLLERWPPVDSHRVDIVGSDIDTRVLAAAAAGIYERSSLARVPPELLRKYFTAMEPGRYRIIDGLRRSVDFGHLNLTRAAEIIPLGTFHVIFCRNVLIYFDERTRLTVMQNLYSALRPGGFLCLGHSEMLARQELALVLRRFPDAVVYQKPAVLAGHRAEPAQGATRAASLAPTLRGRAASAPRRRVRRGRGGLRRVSEPPVLEERS